MAEKQTIQGGLLSSLVQLLFGGLDKILDSAAEYEEEMGVLKQVNHIQLQDDDGKQYELTIKLAPVRNKSGVFYVEAETNKPGFDVSSINGKAVSLTNKTMKQFNEMVNKLIEDNKLSVVTQEEPTENDDEVNSENEGEELTQDQAQRIVRELKQKFKPIKVRLIGAEQESNYSAQVLGLLEMNFDLSEDFQNCTVTVFVDQIDNDSINIADKSATTKLTDLDSVVEKVKAFRDDYMEQNNIEKATANSSNQVDATLKRVTGSTELELIAINAHCNIRAAMDMLTTVADDPDFIDSFEDDEEKSISIIDDCCDEYGVEEIEEVDISPTYDVLFKAVSELYAKFQAAYWAVGPSEWNQFSYLDAARWSITGLMNSTALWVVENTDHYPCLQNPYGEFADFGNCMEGDCICSECIKDELIKDLDELVILLENYFINLKPNEQTTVGNALEEIKKVLAYC